MTYKNYTIKYQKPFLLLYKKGLLVHKEKIEKFLPSVVKNIINKLEKNS